jgi:hypothetical protein
VELPPLPIPERDPEDREQAVLETRALTSPEPATVTMKAPQGETRPTTVVIKTRTRTKFMRVLRSAGVITGFEITEEVEG